MADTPQVKPVYLVILGLVAGIAWTTGVLDQFFTPIGSTGVVSSPFVATKPTVTMAEYTALSTGMTYEQASQIIGTPGTELSRSEIAGFTTVMYSWSNADGSNMNAMFQNGGLINKAQFGLR